MAEQAPSEGVLPSDTVQPTTIKCNGVKDVARCLQKAARSASPVTLDLNQITIDHPQHLAALRNLCNSAVSHVTLSNGSVVLSGPAKGVFTINCSRLSFKNMEIVRVIRAAPPPAPEPKDDSPSAKADHAGNTIMVVEGDGTEDAPTSTHVTLEDCTLRMEGDPRYCTASAIIAHGASLLRMDRCKLLNMHSWLLVMMHAHVELHDCYVAMVYGTRVQLHALVYGHVSLHGCTLVEEEGVFLPPANSLVHVVDDSALTSTAIHIAAGSTLQLVNTRVRMPLGAQLGRTPYVLVCNGGRVTAINTWFDGTPVCLTHPERGCCFSSCGISGVRQTGNASAFATGILRRLTNALLLVVGAAGVRVEDCTFTNAPDRVAIQVVRQPTVLPPVGGPPLVCIKGCNISNCLHGVQVPVEYTDDIPSIKDRLGEPKGRLTVEVEDTTIEVTPSTIPPQEPQTCLFFEGHVVSATVRRCVMQASGRTADVVFAKEGAHLVMTDCTVTLHGPGTAIMLGLKESPAYAVIERSTITADSPAQFALTDPGPIHMEKHAWTIDGVTATVYSLERALQRNVRNRVLGTDVIQQADGLYSVVLTTTSVDGTITKVPVIRQLPGYPSLLWTWDGATKLVDCKFQGSKAHCGISAWGAGKVELVKCELAADDPLQLPWALRDPGGTVILKDCTVGACLRGADMMDGTFSVLDNTPYHHWWHGAAPVAAQQPGSRALMFVDGLPGENESMRHRSHRVLYITPESSTDGDCRSGSGGGAEASASSSSSSTAARVPAGTPRRPLTALNGAGQANTCCACGVQQAAWATAQGDPTRVMPWCQRCTCMRYCSRECQLRDWSKHTPACQYISQHYVQAAAASKVSSKEK